MSYCRFSEADAYIYNDFEHVSSARKQEKQIMFKCWSCGTEHEYPAASAAPNRDVEAEIIESYRLGYAKGREDGCLDEAR